jgi:hypothetical protein
MLSGRKEKGINAAIRTYLDFVPGMEGMRYGTVLKVRYIDTHLDSASSDLPFRYRKLESLIPSAEGW